MKGMKGMPASEEFTPSPTGGERLWSRLSLPYEFFISLRYLKGIRKGISLTTFISIFGVTVGVAALIATLAVMTGFKEELRNKILGANSHIVVQSLIHDEIDNVDSLLETVKKNRRVVAAAPFILRQVLLSSDTGAMGIVLRGIDPMRESDVTSIEQNMVGGKLDYLQYPQRFRRGNHDRSGSRSNGSVELESPTPFPEPSHENEVLHSEPGIIMGVELASRLELFLGDVVQVISPVGSGKGGMTGRNPIGLTPKIRKFKLVGVFDSGMYEYDATLAYVSIKEAQKFFNLGEKVNGIEVRVDDISDASDIAREIDMQIGFPYQARDWLQLNRNLFSALQLEKIVMFIILVLIILVASFNIVSTLMMTVLQKGREIAILKAMGATQKSIMRIFMLEGVLIGAAGVIIGLPLGLLICSLLARFYILPPDVYYISHLPVQVLPLDLILVSVSALLIGFSATLYPSWKAARLDPAEALRYE